MNRVAVGTEGILFYGFPHLSALHLTHAFLVVHPARSFLVLPLVCRGGFVFCIFNVLEDTGDLRGWTLVA